MKKEELLLKMMEKVGRGRRGGGKKKHHNKEFHDEHPEQEEKKKKKHRKFSPVAENTLILLYREGEMNQRTIANRMNVTGQAVSELMKKLEEYQLINRESGDLNNENIVSLTEKGEEKAKECNEKISAYAEKLFRYFSDDDLETLSILLDKMEYEEDLS